MVAEVKIVGDLQEEIVELAEPVTLQPGLYILAQGKESGSGHHYIMSSIDVAALETHPRILAGSWRPSNGRAYSWGSNLSGTGFETDEFPRIGFVTGE